MKIEDNFLPESLFNKIVLKLLGGTSSHSTFPLYYSASSVDYKEEDTRTNARTEELERKHKLIEGNPAFFCHVFFDNYEIYSSYYTDIILPIVHTIKPKSIMKVKLNLNTYNGKGSHSGWHYDKGESPGYTTSILYLTTNEGGGTLLEDGTLIKPVANRFVSFYGDTLHTGLTETSPRETRALINFNYVL